MSATSRRAQQKAELRGLILDAARQVFVHEGYERVSMRRLAERIEYSPGTIYLHFTGKQDLLNCLVEESFDRLHRALEQSRRKDPVDTLRAGLRAYVEFGLRNPSHYHFAFVVRGAAHRKRGYRPHRAFEYLRDAVRSCVECGRLRATDVETAAQVLWAAVHGITSLLITRPQFPWVARDRLIGETIDNALRGMLREQPDRE